MEQKGKMTNQHNSFSTENTSFVESNESGEARQQIITVQQFVEEEFADKVASGECEVFDILHQDTTLEVSPEILPANKHGLPVKNIMKVDDHYYGFNDRGFDGNHKLVVLYKTEKYIQRTL